MERGTSDFDKWLRHIEQATARLKLVPALDTVARLVAERSGVRLWFVEILGRRLSYIAGEISEQPTRSAARPIPLNVTMGLVSDTLQKLSLSEYSALINSLRRMVSSERGQ